MKIYTNILTVLTKYQNEKRKKRLSLFYVFLYTLVLAGCAANTKNFTDSISSTRAEAMCNKNIEISETIKRIAELSTKISHIESTINRGYHITSEKCEELSGGSYLCINGTCTWYTDGPIKAQSDECENGDCKYKIVKSVNGHTKVCTSYGKSIDKNLEKDKLYKLEKEKARENDKYLAYFAQCKNYVLGLPAGTSDDSPQLLNRRWRSPPK